MKPYTPQPREYYISKCRYYNGDDSSDIPAEDKLLADYEECWVRSHYKEEDLEYLRECLKDYKAFGLGHFNESSDGVPITLKALLWSRWMHWGDGYGTPTGFIRWFRREYLKEHIA